MELEKDGRIEDAIKKAGGITEKADINKINLAYKLEDGQKVYVPSKEDEYYSMTDAVGIDNIKEEKVNINKASYEQIKTLPGIGDVAAKNIIEYRKENGEFKTKEELKNVNGIGENKYKKLEELIEI